MNRSLFLIGIVLTSLAFAKHNNTAAITGMVTDWDGAAVGEAKVEARSSGWLYTTATSTTGKFTLIGLRPGKYQVSVEARALKDYENRNLVLAIGQTLQLNVRLEDYETLNTLGEGRNYINDLITEHPVPPGPAPRTPDGRPDFTGVWRASRTIQQGKPEMLPWAAAETKRNQENHGKDWSFSRCLPAGATLEDEYLPYRIVQSPAIIAVVYEDDLPRQIHLDGRPHPKGWEPDYDGHSVGHWEGDELVVDTVGFNDRTWLDDDAHPHTNKLHLTERYTRPDLGHLKLRITIDDPGAYKKPWSFEKISDLAPEGEEIGQYVCAENNQDIPHLVGK
jgi:hypothetical protein